MTRYTLESLDFIKSECEDFSLNLIIRDDDFSLNLTMCDEDFSLNLTM